MAQKHPKEIFAICTSTTGGYPCEQSKFDASGIKLGDKNKVIGACIQYWSTTVQLEKFKGSFNSVFFRFVDENGTDYDIFSDERFLE